MGGSEVISYTVQFDNRSGGASFYTFASGIIGTSYTATGLTKGKTYQFKVIAVNEYGAGPATAALEVLTAQVPARPGTPFTTWSQDPD